MNLKKIKLASLKAIIVLVPTYAMAYITDKMVWVIPTLAASSFFAATIEFDNENTTSKDSKERLEDYEPGNQYEPSESAGSNIDGAS